MKPSILPANGGAVPRLRNAALLVVCTAMGYAIAGQPAIVSAGSKSIPGGSTVLLTDWPRITSAIGKDAAMEARIKAIVASMTLQQKIGQMTQPEIKSVTPAQVREFYIGSVLNGGGSWPGLNKRSSIRDWLNLADQYYDASMTTDMKVKVPVIWGTDAVHGHNNVLGATVFPHNIALGAARDPALVHDIGVSVGKAVRATGINWVFAPTLAVVQDSRWGRTYESFSDDANLVRAYGKAYTRGLQGKFTDDGNVVATAKHYIGDGGTAQGRDQGVNTSSLAGMINVHGMGYYGALSAGVQTVMASFNSWNDVAAGVDYGKMHGSKKLLTDILKDKMGFDGLVVSDWNGIAQVSGCTNARCAQAINAGIDMVMVPDDWREFITATVAQVKSGEIPIERIDDAVTRILRVKLRAGLFDKRPSQGRYAGKADAILDRELARRAVRKSLVLLKNDRAVLPLKPNQKILVVGKSADSVQNQAGGWTLTWQGTENSNADFPAADSILSGIRERAGSDNVVFSETAKNIDPGAFDAIVAVIGETPYAEGDGDIPPTASLRHSSRYPEDLAVLKAVSGKGRPVITLYLSGRPLFTNDLLNYSDAFVVAWLPGTEGKGISDVIFKAPKGGAHVDFAGRLPFAWPGAECPVTPTAGSIPPKPLFARGYGLTYRNRNLVGKLPVDPAPACTEPGGLPIFGRASHPVAALFVSSVSGPAFDAQVSQELSSAISLPPSNPVVRVETTQINTQQDARKVTWTGPARFLARASSKLDLQAYATRGGALKFDVVVQQAPQQSVSLSMSCGEKCEAVLDVTDRFRDAAGKGKQVIKVPLSCFAGKGMDLTKVAIPFSVSTAGSFEAAFTNIGIAADAGKDADAMICR